MVIEETGNKRYHVKSQTRNKQDKLPEENCGKAAEWVMAKQKHAQKNTCCMTSILPQY